MPEQDAAAELSSAFPFRRPDIYDGLVVFARIRWLHEVRHAFVLQRHCTALDFSSAVLVQCAYAKRAQNVNMSFEL